MAKNSTLMWAIPLISSVALYVLMRNMEAFTLDLAIALVLFISLRNYFDGVKTFDSPLTDLENKVKDLESEVDNLKNQNEM